MCVSFAFSLLIWWRLPGRRVKHQCFAWLARIVFPRCQTRLLLSTTCRSTAGVGRQPTSGNISALFSVLFSAVFFFSFSKKVIHAHKTRKKKRQIKENP